jgi:hypothetical protein
MTTQTQSVAESHFLPEPRSRTRGALLRRLVLFQVKLFVDGLRDLILSPISFAVAAIGILFGGRNPHGAFDRLMQAGHQSDQWINLFGYHQAVRGNPCLEDVLTDLETAVREDHARGGLTAEAERRVRNLAAEIKARASRG